jgi:hypothetical protein
MARLSQTACAMRNLLRNVPRGWAPSLARRAVGGSLLAATVVVFVRCSDMASTEASDFGGDGGNGSDGNENPVTQGDAGASDAADLPRVLIVAHASTDAFDFRLCFGLSDSSDGANAQIVPIAPVPDDPKSPMPQANYPGIARGNGAIVDPDLGPAAALSSKFVVPYLVNAFSLATRPAASCKELFECSGKACIQSPGDFVKLPAVAATSFMAGGTRLLGVVGAGTAIKMKEIALDGRSAGSAMRGQFAHLSTLGQMTARYGTLDGGADGSVSLGAASFGEVGSPTAASIAPPTMAGFGSTGITFSAGSAGDAGAVLLRASLAEIQQASDPSQPPDEFYKNDRNYVFVVVGDPAVPKTIDGGAPNPEYAARGLHVVAVRSSALAPEAL